MEIFGVYGLAMWTLCFCFQGILKKRSFARSGVLCRPENGSKSEIILEPERHFALTHILIAKGAVRP